MKVLGRDDILQAMDLREERVEVMEWGGVVIVREMTAARRIEFEKRLVDDDDQLRVLITAWSCVGEDGALLFSAEDVQGLAGKSFELIRHVSDVALRVNALRRRDVAETKENF